MSTYVALLRGMNLGGRRLANEDLCAAFQALGMGEPRAFLASGNVVFEHDGARTATARALTRGLERELGYPVPTFLRTAAQIRALAARRPFDEYEGVEAFGKPQVVFLHRAPDAAAIDAALAQETDDDWLILEGDELHWLPRHGVGRSELDFRALERALGDTTVRTHNTVARLAAKFL